MSTTQIAAPATEAAAPTGSRFPLFPLFKTGQISATPGAVDALQKNGQTTAHFLIRHVTGDWLELPEEDQNTNRESIACGARIFSAYAMKNGEKLWIITEADRSVTTLFLPDEY